MVLDTICHNSLSEQERLCMVLDNAEVKSDPITSEIVWFHQNSFSINLFDFYCLGDFYS